MAELSIARSRAAQRGAVGIRTRSKWLPFWFLMPALLALLAIQVLPTLYSFYLSTTRVRGGVFRDVGLSNFAYLFGPNTGRTFRNSLENTAIYATSYVVLTLVSGMFVALILNRKIKFTGIYLVIIIVPWVISDVVAGTMWRWLFLGGYGLLQHFIKINLPFLGDSILTTASGAMSVVIIAGVWRGMAFTTLLSLGALQTVPNEIIESAALDGANRFQRFFRIIFPLIRPTVLVMVLLTSIQGVNNVGLIYAITNGGPGGATQTTAFYLLQTGWFQGDFGMGAAISVFLFAINLSLTILYLRLIGRKVD